ncbi:hypothetical protein L0F63_000163 [Massospora cicadina]|nr:hypothetical protein L0F63_000163 [Massospora cicadina]
MVRHKMGGLVICNYDYIVVGGGTGGGTLATELAMKGFKTLLIEAGPEHYGTNQTIPVFHANASEDPATLFDFDVKHYDNDVRYFYPRASVLGGCSVHNAMITVYPNSRDFKLMHKITGDDEWKERNMRKYFKRLEGNQYLLRLLNPDHGFNGWFKTSYINYLVQLKLDPMVLNYILATIGNPLFDLNGKDLFGLNTDKEANVFLPQAVDKNGFTRANFPRYIRSVAKRYPLEIWTNTFVTKILFDGNVAVGVEYKKGRYLYKASPLSSDYNRKTATHGIVMANKEIIISGGTFNTPQILMLSGVGDKHHLTELGIPVVSNVPGVGRNMMDRYEIGIVNQYPRDFKLTKACKFTPTEDDPCYQEYLYKRTGPYTSNGILSGQLRKSDPRLKEPDLFMINALIDFHGYYRGYSNKFAADHRSTTRLILKAHTNNTNGRVKLISTDPFDAPDINFHSFSDGNSDLDILVKAIKRQRRFLKSIVVPNVEIHPGKDVRTDAEVRRFIKANAWGHHACCTAKMGPPTDPMAVVDSKFRVRGLRSSAWWICPSSQGSPATSQPPIFI